MPRARSYENASPTNVPLVKGEGNLRLKHPSELAPKRGEHMDRFIAHAKIQKAQESLSRAIQNRRPGTIIPVIGVPGVGKSTVRRRTLREHFAKPEWFAGGRWPVVELFAGLPDKGFYNSKAMARRSGAQLLDPTVKWLEPMPGESREFFDLVSGRLTEVRASTHGFERKPATETVYWESFADSAVERGLQVLSYDHCNSMLVNRRGTEPIQHLQHLMTLAEENDFTLILTGTPPAVDLWESLPELSRRVEPVWVESYDCRISEEALQVAELMKTIAGELKTKPKNLLDKIGFEVVYANSGVIKLLQDCFSHAQQNAKASGRSVLMHKDFEEAYPHIGAFDAMEESIRLLQDAKQRVSSRDLRKRISAARASSEERAE